MTSAESLLPFKFNVIQRLKKKSVWKHVTVNYELEYFINKGFVIIVFCSIINVECFTAKFIKKILTNATLLYVLSCPPVCKSTLLEFIIMGHDGCF